MTFNFSEPFVVKLNLLHKTISYKFESVYHHNVSRSLDVFNYVNQMSALGAKLKIQEIFINDKLIWDKELGFSDNDWLRNEIIFNLSHNVV